MVEALSDTLLLIESKCKKKMNKEGFLQGKVKYYPHWVFFFQFITGMLFL